jgi:hypothetical protein
VPADRHVLDAEQVEQLERLSVVAGRDPHLVATLAQLLDHRPEDDRMGGGGHVDPDPHRGRVTVRRGRPAAGRARPLNSIDSIKGYGHIAMVATGTTSLRDEGSGG